jgi:hypothetical protein
LVCRLARLHQLVLLLGQTTYLPRLAEEPLLSVELSILFGEQRDLCVDRRELVALIEKRSERKPGGHDGR